MAEALLTAEGPEQPPDSSPPILSHRKIKASVCPRLYFLCNFLEILDTCHLPGKTDFSYIKSLLLKSVLIKN